MKILQVAGLDSFAYKFLLPLIETLVQEGHTVDVACNCSSGENQIESTGLKIYDIPFARNFNFLKHFINIVALVRLMRREKYDCVHTHNPMASLVARLAGKLAGVPVIIYTAHGFYFHENMHPVAYKIVYYLEKIWSKLFTDYLFFQSEEDYRLAIQNNFKSKDKLIYIGNGVSKDSFDPTKYNRDHLRLQMSFGPTDLVLLFVGRLVREKGIVELIEAFKTLKPKYANLKLVLVGSSLTGDRGVLNLRELINQVCNNHKSDIYILGQRNDIPQLLSIADIFVLPSYREGLPRSIIEAMAMGKPIVATNIRGCREQVTNQVNGYLCALKNSGDLAEKLDALLSNPSELGVFGANSRRVFSEKYDECKVISRQLEIFRRL